MMYLITLEKRSTRQNVSYQTALSLEIGTMEKDPQELKRVYQIGVKEAKKNLQAIKTYLSE